jgi:cell division protein FtsL
VSIIESPRTRPDRAPREATRPQLRVVEPPRRRRTRLIGALVLLTLFSVLMATVAFHVNLVQGQQRIDRMNRQADAAQARYDRLRIEVDRLQSPARVVSSATKLGMVNPDNSTWLAPQGSGAANPPSDPSSAGDAAPDDYLDVKPHLGDNP